jgi:hypothetical protein
MCRWQSIRSGEIFKFPKAVEQMSDTILSSFLWSVADLLRADYKQSDYDKSSCHSRFSAVSIVC